MNKVILLSSYDYKRKKSYSASSFSNNIPRYKSYPMTEEMKREVSEIMQGARDVLESIGEYYMSRRNQEEIARHERRKYLQELDDFEETIHGRHGKLVD